jgi:hypothetical protein
MNFSFPLLAGCDGLHLLLGVAVAVLGWFLRQSQGNPPGPAPAPAPLLPGGLNLDSLLALLQQLLHAKPPEAPKPPPSPQPPMNELLVDLLHKLVERQQMQMPQAPEQQPTGPLRPAA